MTLVGFYGFSSDGTAPFVAGAGVDGNGALVWTAVQSAPTFGKSPLTYKPGLVSSGAEVLRVGVKLRTGDSGVWSARGIQIYALCDADENTVISLVTGDDGKLEVWRYFDGVLGSPTLLGTSTGPLPSMVTPTDTELQVAWGDSIELHFGGAVAIANTVVDTGISVQPTWIVLVPYLYDDASGPLYLLMDDPYLSNNQTDAGSNIIDFLDHWIVARQDPTGLGYFWDTDPAPLVETYPDDDTSTVDTSAHLPVAFAENWAVTLPPTGWLSVGGLHMMVRTKAHIISGELSMSWQVAGGGWGGSFVLFTSDAYGVWANNFFPYAGTGWPTAWPAASVEGPSGAWTLADLSTVRMGWVEIDFSLVTQLLQETLLYQRSLPLRRPRAQWLHGY